MIFNKTYLSLLGMIQDDVLFCQFVRSKQFKSRNWQEVKIFPSMPFCTSCIALFQCPNKQEVKRCKS